MIQGPAASPGASHIPEEPLAVRVANLRFRYPGSREPALHDISFEIAPGERVGLLGPNGAGKSTLMRVMCGYHAVASSDPKQGLWVLGRDVATRPLRQAGLVGYLPEHVPAYMEMRVHEQLWFRATLKKIPRSQRKQEVARVCEKVGLSDVTHTTIGRLSRGYRQRVGIADALLGSPRVVILDEPTIGLDPNQILEIRDVLLGLSREQTLIFSSHILQDVEAICDRILIMSRGTIVADEQVANNGPSSLVVEWMGDVTSAATCVIERVLKGYGMAMEAVHRPRSEGGRTFVVLADPPDGMAANIGKESLAQALVLMRMETGRARLEERFARATGFSGGWGR